MNFQALNASEEKQCYRSGGIASLLLAMGYVVIDLHSYEAFTHT